MGCAPPGPAPAITGQSTPTCPLICIIMHKVDPISLIFDMLYWVLLYQFIMLFDRYLKTWFTVDFVSSLPFDHIVEAASHQATGLLGASRVLRILRLVKLLSLLKLLRLSRLVRYVHQYEEVCKF